MTEDKRYTVKDTAREHPPKVKVVALNKVRAYKLAINELYGDTALKEVPEETNLQITNIEAKKEKWVDID